MQRYFANLIPMLKYFIQKVRIRTPKTSLFRRLQSPLCRLQAVFKTDFRETLSKVSPSNKSIFFFAENININLLDYSTNPIKKIIFQSFPSKQPNTPS